MWTGALACVATSERLIVATHVAEKVSEAKKKASLYDRIRVESNICFQM